MSKLNQDKNLRRHFAKEINKLMKNQEKEKKIRYAKVAKAYKDMEVDGSSTYARDSKIGSTSETTLKNPKKEKEPDE